MALALGALVLWGCMSPLEQGERRYHEGDLRGALEVWEIAAEDDAKAVTRIAEVQAEFERLVTGYIASGKELESEGRLAESILDYRLALKLQPEDTAILTHVQLLARQLASHKLTLRESYDRVRSRGDLQAASDALERLRSLDPFEPEYEVEKSQLQAALAAEYRARRARIRREQAERVETLVEAGRAAFGDEQLETALDLWRRALLIDPDNERLQAYIARAEHQLENLERLRSEPGENGGS